LEISAELVPPNQLVYAEFTYHTLQVLRSDGKEEAR